MFYVSKWWWFCNSNEHLFNVIIAGICQIRLRRNIIQEKAGHQVGMLADLLVGDSLDRGIVVIGRTQMPSFLFMTPFFGQKFERPFLHLCHHVGAVHRAFRVLEIGTQAGAEVQAGDCRQVRGMEIAGRQTLVQLISVRALFNEPCVCPAGYHRIHKQPRALAFLVPLYTFYEAYHIYKHPQLHMNTSMSTCKSICASPSDISLSLLT